MFGQSVEFNGSFVSCQCLISVCGERVNFMIHVGRSSSCLNKAWLIPSVLSYHVR